MMFTCNAMIIQVVLCAVILLNSDSYSFRHGRAVLRKSALRHSNRWEPPSSTTDGISNSVDDDSTQQGITYTVELPKASGISWGSDLSFRWIYVQDIDPQGEAMKTGMVRKGDYIIGCGNISLIAADFDYVITSLANQPSIYNATFFRGSKEQMIGAPVLSPSQTIVTVTVKESGKADRTLQCPGGTNLRTLLVGNGINVYRSLTRWTNCNGKQRCGTCIVEVQSGLKDCSRRALDEDMVLAENPDSYRLSCVTSVYGDVTVEVQGAVGAAQWTR